MRSRTASGGSRSRSIVLGAALALASAAPSFVLAACAAKPAPGPVPPPPTPSWLARAPTGCAIGFSGPTLNPGDSIRYARRSAVGQLIAGSAEATTSIDSTLLVDGASIRGSGEFTRLDIKGLGRRTRIIAMWAEATPDPRSTTNVRHVYALACRDGATPPGIPAPSYPEWVMNLPRQPGKRRHPTLPARACAASCCAVAVSSR